MAAAFERGGDPRYPREQNPARAGIGTRARCFAAIDVAGRAQAELIAVDANLFAGTMRVPNGTREVIPCRTVEVISRPPSKVAGPPVRI